MSNVVSVRNETYSISSVDNALNILEAFCELEGKVSLTHLSQVLGMQKSQVFRYLATFEQRGYVQKDEKSSKYSLGISAYEMGQKSLSRMSLLVKAKPEMERLARLCDEAVYLAVPRNQDIFLLDMVNTTQAVGIVPLVGNHYPSSETAAGKVILAFGPAQGGEGGNVFPSSLDRELEGIRQQTVAVDRGGFGEGVVSLAVPFFDGQDDVSGSLCIVAPEFRLTAERIDADLLPRLKRSGEAVSSRLGYFSPPVQ